MYTLNREKALLEPVPQMERPNRLSFENNHGGYTLYLRACEDYNTYLESLPSIKVTPEFLQSTKDDEAGKVYEPEKDFRIKGEVTIEILYHPYPDVTYVHYRRPKGSAEANDLIKQVEENKSGLSYSWREVDERRAYPLTPKAVLIGAGSPLEDQDELWNEAAMIISSGYLDDEGKLEKLKQHFTITRKTK